MPIKDFLSDATPVKSDFLEDAKPTDSPVRQPGFLENLGHAFGIGKQESEQQLAHPVTSGINAYPPVAMAEGAYRGGKRILGEVGKMGSAALEGNPAGVASHAISAIPFIGPAMDKMADESPATTPSQSYMSKVWADATPGNVGTALGTASQVAPMALGASDLAAPNRPTIPTPNIPRMGRAIRTAAIGDPDVALTKGLGITARSRQGLGTLNSVGESDGAPALDEAQGARPYGKGAKNEADLQSKLTAARPEINVPRNQALDLVGDKTVSGPEGRETVNKLETQRRALSPQLDALRKNPADAARMLQNGKTAWQDLQDRYNSLNESIDSALGETGINAKAIRTQDAQVASVLNRIQGRTTLPEAKQPYGFAKIPNLLKLGNGSGIDLLEPLKTAAGAARDIAAGDYWYDRPTDVNIRHAFYNSGPKPTFTAPRADFAKVPQSSELGFDTSTGPINVNDVARARMAERFLNPVDPLKGR